MKCPCCTDLDFAACCEPLLKGGPATTPEQLMRSRFSAFHQKNIAYVRSTTDPQALHEFDEKSTADWMNQAKFTRLEILRATNEGNKGTVEFKAYFRIGDGPEEVHHEISKFRKQAGTWYFRDGRVQAPASPAQK